MSIPDKVLQMVCPSPRRLLQAFVADLGLATGIDIGCGLHSPLTKLRASGLYTTGVDADLNTILEAKSRGLHDAYLVDDLRRLNSEEQYDVVVCSHVIEHLSREDGMLLLVALEKMARHVLYVETPYGFLPQKERDGNPYQRHWSGWYPKDFLVRGYGVYGMGLSVLRGQEGRATKLPESATRFLERATQIIPYRLPTVAHAFAAIRVIDKEGNLVPG